MMGSWNRRPRDLRIALEKWARDVEPRLLSGAMAARQLRQVARMEAICASVKTRLARRVDESNVWQQGGHKTPAHFVARQTGTSIHQAVTILQTGERLEALPATDGGVHHRPSDPGPGERDRAGRDRRARSRG